MAKLPLIFATFIVAVGLNSSAKAQSPDVGSFEFKWACSSCHGNDAKGKGPISSELKIAPADLTVLAKKNNGVFPVSAVYDIIDGRKVIAAHGSREMPIWGAFNESYLYIWNKLLDPSYDPEVLKRTRILAIIDYLNRIQEK